MINVIISSKDEDYGVEDIVFFDSDIKKKKRKIFTKKMKRILIIDSDYGSFSQLLYIWKKWFYFKLL